MSHQIAKAPETPCEVAILGGFDKGKRSFTAYCDCGKKHTMAQVRAWQKASGKKEHVCGPFASHEPGVPPGCIVCGKPEES